MRMRVIDVILIASLATLAVACGSESKAKESTENKDTRASEKKPEAAPAAHTQTAAARAPAPAPSAPPSANGTAPAAPAAPPGSALELVQKSSPGAQVAPSDLQVKGIDLFVVSDVKGATGRLSGVIGGKVVDGIELVKAAVDAKPPVKTLAHVALKAGAHDGDILDAPLNAEQRKARVRAPRVVGKQLVFWVWTSGVPRMLEQGKLDRATGALALDVPASSRPVAITNSIAALTDPAVSIDTSAVQLLAASCGELKPKMALLGALANHPSPEIRAVVADSAHKCGPAALQPLIDAMEHDKAALVRPRAASALGRIGDVRARPALAKAARSEDANLSWAAKNALKKLQ